MPRYDGPRDEQTDAVERALGRMAERMYAAEAKLQAIQADLPTPGPILSFRSNGPREVPPSPDSWVRIDKDIDIDPDTRPCDDMEGPLVLPPGLLSAAAFESDISAVEELRLLKAQISDVARVCMAVAEGDLSQKITVPAQGVVMVQLKDVVNTMVDKLGSFAQEVAHVALEARTGGYLGGAAMTDDLRGTWGELRTMINRLAGNMTNQVSLWWISL